MIWIAILAVFFLAYSLQQTIKGCSRALEQKLDAVIRALEQRR